jgi:hypothetical protein
MKLRAATTLLQILLLAYGCYLLDQGSIGFGLFNVLLNGMSLHAQFINIYKDE